MSTYFRLVKHLRPHLRIFLVAVACMIGSTLLEGVQLGSIFVLADRIVTDKVIPIASWMPGPVVSLVQWLNAADRLPLVTWFSLAIPVLFFLKGLFEFGQSFYMNDTAQRIIRDLRQAMFDKFMSLSLDFHTRAETGNLMSRILYDTGVIQNSITEGLTDLILQGCRVVMYLAIVLAIDWRMSLLVFVIVPFIAWPIASLGRRLKKLSHEGQAAMGRLSSVIVESLAGIRVLKAFLAEGEALWKFSDANEWSYRLMRKSQKRMNLLSPVTELVGALAAAFFFWYGGRRVIEGTMSLGGFMAFLLAMLSLIRPFKRLARLHGVNQQALASAERMFDVLDAQPTVVEQPDAKPLADFRQDIRYEGVSFQYDTHKPAIRHADLVIRFGETLALVGPSGGGKTTLVNLLPRFFDPTGGRILIDGMDLRDVTLASLRRQIGLVTQDTLLFNDTVRANISLGRSEADLTAVIEAAKMANAHSFISKLEQGYDTVIGERGGLLSGGERQRLAIARAFLNNPPILILDEATSQLDAESEHLVSEALARLTQGRTVFFITHRLSSIRLAHRIVLIQEGRIVEHGTHDELLQKSPLYRRFCELQLIHAGDQDSSTGQ